MLPRALNYTEVQYNRTHLETHLTPAMQCSRTTAPLAPRALELRLSSTLAVDSLQAKPRSKCFKAEENKAQVYF
jgi:hypothetical protein